MIVIHLHHDLAEGATRADRSEHIEETLERERTDRRSFDGAGFQPPDKVLPYVTYATTKAAVNQMTRTRRAMSKRCGAPETRRFRRQEINNVGVAEVGSVVDVSEAEWDRVFSVN